MADSSESMTARSDRSSVIGGLALLVVALAMVSAFAIEMVARASGYPDGDNPVDSLGMIETNPNAYSLSGLALVVAGLALLLATFAVLSVYLGGQPELAPRFVSALGVGAALLLFLGGVMRLQAPGTITHIAGLDRDWGYSAYLAVQMAGTQGALSAGIFAACGWAIGVSIVAARRGTVRPPLALLGILPGIAIAIPILALMGRLVGLEMPEGGYLVYIGALVIGLPLWAAVIGAAMLVRDSSKTIQ